jgi:uncharacterized MAPEG superfamily protein
MTPLLWIVVKLAALTYLCLLVASLWKARGWTLPGLKLAMGNRENMPEPSAMAGRAERTARNTLEAFVVFSALALVAHSANKATPLLMQGAETFFWARLLYVPVYVAGVAYLRTGVWTVELVGLAMMVCGLA